MWTDDEAAAKLTETFPGFRRDECDTVCEDCYREVTNKIARQTNVKLKTLKDFHEPIFEEAIPILRKEAIKWVKHHQENLKNPEVEAWIRIFFNITEEDLL